MKIVELVQKGKVALAVNAIEMARAERQAARVMTFVALGMVLAMPGIAMAAPWDGMGDSIVKIFTGGLARSIAIVAVIALGISAMRGKINWEWAIGIIVGIVLVFGSATVVDYFISAGGSSS